MSFSPPVASTKMEAHAADLEKRFGITAHVIASDLESPTAAGELHAEVKRRGITLTALANNAGYGTFGEFKDAALDSQLAMMQLNMTSLVALAKLFLPDLLATKGKMLNTASTAAFQPGPYMAVYYATKAFVLSFSEASQPSSPKPVSPSPHFARPHRLRLSRQSRHAPLRHGQRQATSRRQKKSPAKASALSSAGDASTFPA